MKNKKGFTLIEVIIYIALFSILIGSTFILAYQIMYNSGKLSVRNTTEEEGNFVMRKFDWALTGISSFTNTSNTLHTNKYNGNQIDIKLVGTKINTTESTGPADFITTDNVSVSSLLFTPTGGTPSGITATATINGIDFSVTKYIRK